MQPSVTGLFEDVLNKGPSLRVKVTGMSMRPFLRGGEIVTIRKVPHFSLKTGDLILFKDSRDFPVIHRIIKKKKSSGNKKTFQTKGDAVILSDEPVTYSQILGKVCKIEKKGLKAQPADINLEAIQWRIISSFIVLIQRIRSAIIFGF